MWLVTWLHNENRLVPILVKGERKTVVAILPLQGDELFEQRARNLKQTFRDGLNP